jgi:hypothetical protein
MTNEVNPHEAPHPVQPDDLALYALGALDASELARLRHGLGAFRRSSAACA